MNLKQRVGCAAAIISLCLTLPIGMWLQYQILKRVAATDLMWFLFFVNIPFVILINILSKIAELMVAPSPTDKETKGKA